MINTALDEVAYDLIELAERSGGKFHAAPYAPSLQK
jgi:hypothetical protein